MERAVGSADDDDITPPNPTEHVLDGAKYLALMREFAEQRSAYDKEKVDLLLVAYDQLASVLKFFGEDPVVQYNSLTLPLERLLTSIHDTLRGSPSPLLNKVNRSPGAPTDLFRDLLRGQIVGALNILIDAGMRSVDAAVWLMTEADRRKIRTTDGGKIKAKDLLDWRSLARRGKVSSSQVKAADSIREQWIRLAIYPATVEAAKRYACDVLAATKHYDFAKTPGVIAKD